METHLAWAALDRVRLARSHGSRIDGYVLVVLALELGHEVGDHAIVEVLSSQVSVSCSRLHLEDPIL